MANKLCNVGCLKEVTDSRLFKSYLNILDRICKRWKNWKYFLTIRKDNIQKNNINQGQKLYRKQEKKNNGEASVHK